MEVLDGPRKGKVITSSQVKFREEIFPHGTAVQTGTPTTHEIVLWHDVQDDSDPLPAILESDDEDEDASPHATSDESDEPDAGGAHPQNTRRRTLRRRYRRLA